MDLKTSIFRLCKEVGEASVQWRTAGRLTRKIRESAIIEAVEAKFL